jgi:hypothetical protein
VSLSDFGWLYAFSADGARDAYQVTVRPEVPLEPGMASTLRYKRREGDHKGVGTSVRPPFLVRGSLNAISAPLGTPLRAAGHLTLTARAACDGEKDAIACGDAQGRGERRGREPEGCRCVIVELRNTTAAPINVDDEKRIFELSFRVRSTSRALDSRLKTQPAPATPVLPPGGAVEEVYLLNEAGLAPDQLMLNLAVRTSTDWLPWSLAID